MDGRSKPPTGALVKKLILSTYWRTDEPRPSQMPWQKFKFPYLRVDKRTKPPMNALYKSSYLWVDERTKPLTSALVKNLSPPTGGWMNQATHECLGQKSKSSYLRMDGRTKPFTSAFVKDLSLPTYRRTDEPSHSQVFC